MKTLEKVRITVTESVKLPVDKVWKYWTDPADITGWNNASDDWHTPWAENDLRPGGRFLSRMESKDGTMGFDFGGTYDEVKLHERIAYTIDDGRKVVITFEAGGSETGITETFEAEHANSTDLQRDGWQAILTNFRRYAESAP